QRFLGALRPSSRTQRRRRAAIVADYHAPDPGGGDSRNYLLRVTRRLLSTAMFAASRPVATPRGVRPLRLFNVPLNWRAERQSLRKRARGGWFDRATNRE